MKETSIAELVARADGAALAELAESDDKEMRKAARKGLHQLRTRGIEVPASRGPVRGNPPSASAPSPEMPCLVSPWDPAQERVLWLARPGAAGGVQAYQAGVHERLGLLDFEAAELTRKVYREVMREMQDKIAAAVCSWRHARAELETAYERTMALSRAVPPSFARVRAQLGKAEPWPAHPALERWPEPPEVSQSEILALAKEPECRTWAPAREALEQAAIKVAEVEQSQLMVTDEQRRQARLDAVRRAARNYFADSARRAEMRKRLLDVAYLVAEAGPKRDRVAQAARAAAEEFGPGGLSPEEGHFAWHLFERCFRLTGPESIAAGQPDPPADKPSSGLIVTP